MEDSAAYIRISDEGQSRFSLTSQEKDVKAYCTLHGLNLMRIFTDDGQSAFTFNRKEWKELEKYLKENKNIKYLIIPHLDRFSRGELVNSLTKLEDIEKRLKINVRTISDPIDLDTEDIGVQMKRVMELLMSNYEWKRIKKRTTDGIYTALSQGRYISKAPVGYLNSKGSDDKPLLRIDEARAPVIRQIFDLYNNGLELEEVRQLVKTDGFSQKGRSAVRRILENPVYAGLIRVPKNGKTPEKLVKGIHEGIVSELEFWNAHSRLNARTTVAQKHDDVYLRGILHCHCGKVMTAGKSKGKLKHYWYYFCNEHRVNFNADKIHKIFDETLTELSFSKSFSQKLSAKLQQQFDNATKSKDSDLTKYKKDLQVMQQKIATVEERYLMQSDMNPETFKKVIGELKQQEGNLLENISELEVSNDQLQTILNEVIPQLSDLKKLFHDLPLETKHLFLDMVFNKSLLLEKSGFRTLYLNPLFSHNSFSLNKKGLLKIEQPSSSLGLSPVSAPGGT
ncbi:recombinase family protein [Niabella sp. CJ426]|uniref:recombinase family protein n=1 Tax=Niabella sp. CJ426 TaxID=3393740 RepID=UPI003D0823A9